MLTSRLRKHAAFDSFKFPEFRNYILSRFFFIFVLNMQATLISWTVYDLTKDPFSIGLVGLVEFFPAFITAFFSGYIIDKNDKRKMLLLSIAGNALLTISLCFVTSNFAAQLMHKHAVLMVIYGIVFCTGIVRVFAGPTSFALVSLLVPREYLPNAITWHSGMWQVAAVSGPALAGILYGTVGITYTFYLMIFFMIIAVTGASLIKPKPFVSARQQEPMWQSIKQGFRFIWHSKEVLGAMSLDLFAVFFGGATALLPYFADVILKTGPQGLGMLRSAPALGGVCILLLMTFRPLKRNQGRNMLFCVFGFGLCIILFGLSKYFYLSLVALFFSGVLDGISVIVRSTILQLKTPDDMRGRVASLNSMFIMSSNELGAFESGTAAKLFGVVPGVIFGGAMTIAVAVTTWFKAPGLRKLEY
ncbi:MFS transporter [Pollutibacter soli]|uniref:MFS transporter n=1 Tax=Pollutibacter soli TaxID=3034157 RepID=UPI003013CBA8